MRKLIYAALAVVGGLAIGLGSAVMRLSEAGSVAVPGNTAWVELDPASGNEMLPYALGLYLGAGQVPPSFTVRQFKRIRDEEGNALRGDCAYVLEGKVPPARWWTLAATDAQGRVVNPQSVIVAGQAFRDAEGAMRVSFAPWPIAGNWVRVDSGTYGLMLALHDVQDDDDKPVTLPVVRKGRC
jgi:hypothetical protein